MSAPQVNRRFVRLPAGQVHCREAGEASAGGHLPLWMAHAGPGGAGTLLPLITDLAHDRYTIAPDLLGNGDSDPPPIPAPDLDFYVETAVNLMDTLGLAQVDFYGQHTGAHLGCELAIRHPSRVRRLILDGIALFPPDLKAQMVAHYAPPLTPDAHGGHLLWAWQFVRELTVHFPHFLRDPAHRLHQSAVMSPAATQALVLELLKSLPTWHLAYQAVFQHPLETRLPLIAVPTLIMCTNTDPLCTYLDAASTLLPTATKRLVATAGRADTIRQFLAA